MFHFFCKMRKKLPFTKNLITSTHHKVPHNGCKWVTKDTKHKWKHKYSNMNQKFHFQTHIPLTTSSKIGRHSMAKKNFGRHLMIPRWQPNTDLIHHGWPKFVNVVQWQLNLVITIGWRSNLFTMQLWRPKTFRLPHTYGDQKPFNCPHTLFVFVFHHSPPPLMAIETFSVTMLCDPIIKN
jgi:hypothetical protein